MLEPLKVPYGFVEKLKLFTFQNNPSFHNSSNLSISLFSSQSRFEAGCNLMTTYQECVGNQKGCMPDEGVHSWGEVEVFMCQLVLPSVKEHAGCFKSSADPRCDARWF